MNATQTLLDAFTTYGWVFALTGFLLGLCVAGLRLLAVERENTELKATMRAEETARETLDNRFKLTAQDALRQAQEGFLTLARENLKQAQADGAYDLEKRQKAIDDLVKPVKQNLEEMNKALQQVKGTDTALREDIRNLNRETARLVGALRDPAAQGQWGEFILEGLLDKSGLMKGVHYETQFALTTSQGGRQRPDAVIHMQDGFNIIIDSKAPINEYTQRLGQELSEQEHVQVIGSLARNVREHVKALGKKGYWEGLDSPDFTVMFLPSEHLYSMALRADPSLVDFAAEREVIIASPTLLMSLLRVVSMSWRQVELAKNAQEISERGADLYKRLVTFTNHIGKVGKNLHTAMKGYDDAVGSLEKSVLPAARKFKDLQPSLKGEALETPLDSIAKEPRALSLHEEDEQERVQLKKAG